ncbi:MAG: hypothetical protein HY924_11685 [Elusimicrobia bacterium]|nr:hypothetical protein [Elusimicrobiota bacterium]
MVETLEFLIRQASEEPRHDRKALFKELLRSEVFLLNIGAPVQESRTVKLAADSAPFMVWADKDPELGGSWVPVFAARDTVSEFVLARGLEAPGGQAFLWMGFETAQIFNLLLGVECFAGVRLFVTPSCFVTLGWTEVKALSQGKLPLSPERYEVPAVQLELTEGLKVSCGRLKEGEDQILAVPEAGRFRAEDVRKLVRTALGGSEGWMPCRHYLQVLRYLWGKGAQDSDEYLGSLLECLIGFEMYGEAESLCRWLGPNRNEAHSWKRLAHIFSKTGRFQECARLCGRGIEKYPEERFFPVCGARALLDAGLKDEARKMISAGLERFHGDEDLEQLSLRL